MHKAKLNKLSYGKLLLVKDLNCETIATLNLAYAWNILKVMSMLLVV